MIFAAGHVLHIEHIPMWTVFLFGVAIVIALALTVRWILTSAGTD